MTTYKKKQDFFLADWIHSAVRRIGFKWKTFKTVANLARTGHPNKFSPSSDHLMLRDHAKKNTRAHVKCLY